MRDSGEAQGRDVKNEVQRRNQSVKEKARDLLPCQQKWLFCDEAHDGDEQRRNGEPPEGDLDRAKWLRPAHKNRAGREKEHSNTNIEETAFRLPA